MSSAPATHAPATLWRAAGVAALVYVVFFLLTTYVLPRFGFQPALQSGAQDMPTSLDLTALLRQVKMEVNAATRQMLENRENAMFEVKELEIEVNFVITREAGVDTPKLVPIGLQSKVSSEKVHRIKLTLDPVPNLDKPRQGKAGVIKEPADVTIQ